MSASGRRLSTDAVPPADHAGGRSGRR